MPIVEKQSARVDRREPAVLRGRERELVLERDLEPRVAALGEPRLHALEERARALRRRASRRAP